MCETLRNSFSEVWKIAKAELAYPNAEVVRKALLAVLPAGSIVLLSHTHFGVDLAPGLSISCRPRLSPTCWQSTRCGELSQTGAPGVRRAGQRSCRCEISSGAVITLRPGAFKAVEGVAAAGVCGGQVAGSGRALLGTTLH